MKLPRIISRLSLRKFAIMVAGAASVFTMVGASAQIRPAYTKNVDERGRQPYSITVEFSQSSCSFNCTDFFTLGTGPGARVLLFDAPAVPAGKRLIVEWISAEVPSNNNINSISFQSLRVLANQRAKWQFHGPFFGTIPGGGLSGMSSGAFFTVEPGENPHIRVKLGDASAFFAGISISGYLIDASN